MRWTFPLALTFLTICPWPRPALARPEELARSMFWFPWVGAILGLVFWAVHLALAQTLPPLPAAGLLLTVTVIVTRGLHLDGLADTLDGLGGGRTPESRLAIMKDSRLGAFGAMALVLVLVLKFAFFSALGAKGKEPMLILFPVLSRWGMVLLAAVSPYARSEGGLGQAMTEGVSLGTVGCATLSSLALTYIVSGIHGLPLLAGAGLLVLLLNRFFRRKLGGITGDALGATNELLEVAVLAGVFLL
uniref:Adenosylcobinamide-GDP ribazoletransferase n=1 Tax=Desulfobacca acetoxidans TaxID=60893 RepID=A0A7C3SJ56_9BACT